MTAATSEEGGSHHVLLVSDDEHIRTEARYGFPATVNVTFAKDAVEARESFQDATPDVVVVSLRSGNSGGFALLSEMSHRLRLESIPVLMLLEREQDRWLGERSGADDFLVGPVDTTELVDHTLALL
jgi:DNA-binding response OmpR family regulator